MKYYELINSVVIKQDISFSDSFTKLSEYVNKAMFRNNTLKQIHKDNKVKLYNFSSFYPIEKDKTYKKGRVYIFRIRSIDQQFLTNLMTSMKTTSVETLQIINSELVTKKQKPIKELVSITPVVMTSEEGYKLPELNQLEFVEKRLKELLEKKYSTYFNKTLSVDQLAINIQRTNYKPIKIPYKNINLLGYKFKLEIDLTDEAQTLATIALATGLGEKTSLGFGYSVANFIRR
ncbi:CRISPR-associated endoribonuclease Cas6 [Vallitalea maricola]|uniref:CRISPR-associated endoribonuclease Cas6 n=1 Tax=Vallitalea maricola TaxID=3074433 RepID=A0ACB5UGW3_9FIRM|nr:CRISPR-associated endoribonuclease Cas6 [Vallitalea sp. AN17-2]